MEDGVDIIFSDKKMAARIIPKDLDDDIKMVDSGSLASLLNSLSAALPTFPTKNYTGGERGGKSPCAEILSSDEEEIKVKIDNVDLSLMVALRRNCIWEVECMAMENLELYINTSHMDDEKLAHRLGQIPFTSQDAKKFNYADDCTSDCKGECPLCAVVYTLQVKNVDEHNMRDVTTLDLKAEDESTSVRPTGGPNGPPCPPSGLFGGIEGSETSDKFMDDDHPLKYSSPESVGGERGACPPAVVICSLHPGQEVAFRGVVRKGTAKREKHHKYQPSALVGLKYPAIIKLDQEKLAKLTAKQKKEIVAVANDGIFQYDEVTGILSTTEDPSDSRLCNHSTKPIELVTSFGQEDAIEILPKKDYFMITVSTNGCLKPEEILLWAMENHVSNLRQIHRNLSFAGGGVL